MIGWAPARSLTLTARIDRSLKRGRLSSALGLKNQAEWTAYCQSGTKPADIPRNANQVYRAEWRGFGDWLGTGTVATFDRSYRPFVEARTFVRALGLKNIDAWRAYCRSSKKPDDIPTAPDAGVPR